jgi:ribonucleoside-diphosphate reductase alpha chain
VIPDITFELAKNGEDMYLFSPYDVEKVYGVPFGDISVTEKYREMVDDARIKKTKINAREFFQTLAEIQFESGYPYIMFEDTVNKANPIKGRINMSNLCSEILQVNTPTTYNEDLSYAEIGKDISCNLGSMNIALAMDGKDLAGTVETSIRASPRSATRATSLGALDRGRQRPLARDRPRPDEPARLPRARARALRLRRGHRLHEHLLLHGAVPRAARLEPHRDRARHAFDGFADSTYASGEFFDKYPSRSGSRRRKVAELFAGIHIPTQDDWRELKASIQAHGIYNQNLQAVPPTGSISYINNSTSSIHPIASKIEIRKEGKIGRVYYPAPFMTNDNLEYYQTRTRSATRRSSTPTPPRPSTSTRACR